MAHLEERAAGCTRTLKAHLVDGGDAARVRRRRDLEDVGGTTHLRWRRISRTTAVPPLGYGAAPPSSPRVTTRRPPSHQQTCQIPRGSLQSDPDLARRRRWWQPGGMQRPGGGGLRRPSGGGGPVVCDWRSGRGGGDEHCGPAAQGHGRPTGGPAVLDFAFFYTFQKLFAESLNVLMAHRCCEMEL